jgi:LDH2 family malate/lactate/ureidoglycolate dehydrogenase
MEWYVVPAEVHDGVVRIAYLARGFAPPEAAAAAHVGSLAARHGIHTHNAIKGLDLDDHLGSKAGGCVPGATIEKLPPRYPAVARWNANRKLGQAVAIEAMDECMRLADQFGVGIVAVDNAFHYLWGGGYVIEAANKGYIAYTCCTSALAEVVPFGGRSATLGTNPHSWGFPTSALIGFPICIDWATSMIAMGRVQQLAREGKQLPPDCALDAEGNVTRDPAKVKSLLPFGAHKGYGLALIDELLAAYIGGSLPTMRNRWKQIPQREKGTCAFYFQCIRPDAISGDDFAMGRIQAQNVKVVIEDILAHGNEKCVLPGQLEAQAAERSDRHGGLLFTQAEIDALEKIARDSSAPFDRSQIRSVEVE